MTVLLPLVPQTNEEDEATISRSGVESSHAYVEPVKQHNTQQEHDALGKENKFNSGDVTASSDSYNIKMVVRHRDLKEIMDVVQEYFDKAASAGDQVSAMLEIGRADLDRNFSKLTKTVYHLSSVLSNLSAIWTSKPPLAMKYKLNSSKLNEQGSMKSLCSTLDRILAWEKKLYEEVKARERIKIEHKKKLYAFQSHEYKGGDESKLDKTKTSITRL